METYSGFYIYKHFDKHGEVIYVGLTTDMHARQKNHLKRSKHKEYIHRIEWANAYNYTTMKFYEIFYINLYSPEYNSQHNRKDNVSWLNALPRLDFREYAGNNEGFGVQDQHAWENDSNNGLIYKIKDVYYKFKYREKTSLSSIESLLA